MPVVAVINRKGGSGKSTLATHLAAYCANQGLPVMLGDADRSQSTQVWLRLREHNLPAGVGAQAAASIVGKHIDPRNLLRPPPGTHHVVLDTPGGLHGFDLARMVCHADAVILPVCNSVFDRDSAAGCWDEIKNHPRVTSGRCRVAAVGMRLDTRTRGDEVLRQWAAARSLPFLGVLRETQAYVRCVENGLTLFDMPPSAVAADMAQWAPILSWLKPVLYPEAGVGALRPSFRPNGPQAQLDKPTVSIATTLPRPAAPSAIDSAWVSDAVWVPQSLRVPTPVPMSTPTPAPPLWTTSASAARSAKPGATKPDATNPASVPVLKPSYKPVLKPVVKTNDAKPRVAATRLHDSRPSLSTPNWGQRLGRVLGVLPLRLFFHRDS